MPLALSVFMHWRSIAQSKVAAVDQVIPRLGKNIAQGDSMVVAIASPHNGGRLNQRTQVGNHLLSSY
jgi:hypothetical protein